MQDQDYEEYCQSVIFQISQYLEQSSTVFEPSLDIRKPIIRPREIDSFTSSVLRRLKNDSDSVVQTSTIDRLARLLNQMSFAGDSKGFKPIKRDELIR